MAVLSHIGDYLMQQGRDKQQGQINAAKPIDEPIVQLTSSGLQHGRCTSDCARLPL
jgi:hypothetical protein